MCLWRMVFLPGFITRSVDVQGILVAEHTFLISHLADDTCLFKRRETGSCYFGSLKFILKCIWPLGQSCLLTDLIKNI